MGLLMKREPGQRMGIRLPPDGRWALVCWKPRNDGSGDTLLDIDAPRDCAVVREELIPKDELTDKQRAWSATLPTAATNEERS